MSTKSDSERIQELEAKVEVLSNIPGVLANINKITCFQAALIAAHQESLLAINRVIVGGLLPLPAAERQELLDVISRMETQHDQVLKTVGDNLKKSCGNGFEEGS